jgi:hypothetical protein
LHESGLHVQTFLDKAISGSIHQMALERAHVPVVIFV